MVPVLHPATDADGAKVLVLGGTGWLGHHLADTALRHGCRVTCLARGVTGVAPTGTTFVVGDRDQPGAYDAVSDDEWDVVIDVTSQPGQVRRAVAALFERSRMFVLVSSLSVYADNSVPDGDETAPTLEPFDDDVLRDMTMYGQAKVACEQHVLDAYGAERSFVVRAGLIGGPGDISDRTGYWPWRFAHPAAEDGRVLLPEGTGCAAQVIDVRDLAEWILAAAGAGTRGTFNATGDSVPLAVHLDTARRVAHHRGPLVRAADDWLLAQGVEPWMGPRSLPLWVPGPDYTGFAARSTTRAVAAGLSTRPLEETLADTLAWERDRRPTRPRKAGLADADEAALLALLATR